MLLRLDSRAYVRARRRRHGCCSLHPFVYERPRHTVRVRVASLLIKVTTRRPRRTTHLRQLAANDPSGSVAGESRNAIPRSSIKLVHRSAEQERMKLAAAVFVVVLAGTATASALARHPVARPPLPANSAAQRLLGVSLPWSKTWASDLDAYAARAGRVPSVVATYRDMEGAMLDVTAMNAVVARGAQPLVTVEPWDSSSATDPRYALRNITRGDFDAWFAAGADAARGFGKAVLPPVRTGDERCVGAVGGRHQRQHAAGLRRRVAP